MVYEKIYSANLWLSEFSVFLYSLFWESCLILIKKMLIELHFL